MKAALSKSPHPIAGTRPKWGSLLPPLLILLVLSLAAVAPACTPLPATTPAVTSTATLEETPGSDWYSLYFTDPDSPTAGSFRGGPDSDLAAAIRGAHQSVDAAIYHLNLWSIRNALIAAHNNGVNVRIVMESDNMDEVEVQEMQAAGLVILGDRRESLMHNKFVVIDQAEVWTGSMNFTINGGYFNDNHLVRIHSTRLAENYHREFEEMFLQDMFGDNQIADTPHPILTLNGTQVETYFSPDDDTAARIVALIHQAEKNIYFMAYSFTSDDIAAAMLEQAATGVTVSGVFEEGQYYANTGTEFDRLLEARLDVRLDGNGRNMHHKVIIIDEQTVILGSYNFSRNAETRNDENTLIIHNPEIAAQFLIEFERVFAKAPAK